MERVIFVYGTLMSGFGNHRLLNMKTQKFVGEGSINGWMLYAHKGSWIPMAVYEPTATCKGEVYRITDGDLWDCIDAMERGAGYVLRGCTVALNKGGTIQAEVWVMGYQSHPHTVKIPSGDYRNWIEKERASAWL